MSTMSAKAARAEAETLEAPAVSASGARLSAELAAIDRDRGLNHKEALSAQIRFRRALTAGYSMWLGFLLIDWQVVRHLEAGRFLDFVLLRSFVIVAALPILRRLYRSPPPSQRVLTALDLFIYLSSAIAIGLMCVEFRGIASPYASGLCLVLLARTVTAQDPWRRGLWLSGVPVAGYYVVLLGAALFSPRIAAQLHDPSAVTTLILNSAYVLGTYAFLVIGGHIVWSLRRQIFEARSIGRYRLKRRIASGGMGDVWVAYHDGLKRDVAVKILRPDAQEQNAGAVVRFEREVRATAELAHPNTVRVFDGGTTEDGLWYYAMELLDGENLASHVERLGPMPPARAIHVLGQAARALGEAHERGIVHRDVKPENLFLTSLGGEHDFVKVIDFGIAKVVNVDASMTRTGWVLGTPAYMSPEVATGKEADARSDVYALGAVLYFLLCGYPPFEGDNGGIVLYAHVHERAVPPSVKLGRPLPADLEAVVMLALHKDPDERYGSASELALALARCGVAGKWTFGEATNVARQSSRPPASAAVEPLVSMRTPRAASVHVEPSGGETPPTQRTRRVG
jgi:serine/threonine-protein kinase